MAVAQNIEHWFRQEVTETAAGMTGGLARLKVVVLMAGVLGLDSADKAMVGAVAVQLKHALSIGNVEVGLLVTVSTGIGALATLPMGVLTDRIHRIHMLTISMILWSITMLISGFANSYTMLLFTRLALGAVIATAYPVITSLAGDYFRPGVRGRIWGYVLSGELFGAGFGILVAGEAAALWSWRFSFWVLAVISLAIAGAVWMWLPEPARGGQSQLQKGRKEIPSTEELKENKGIDSSQNKEDIESDEIEKKITQNGIAPREAQILDSNPADMSLWAAVRYILSIRTNVLLITASACGYFFFTGLRTFGLVLLRSRFDLGQITGKFMLVGIGLGAIVGVFITGRLADRLIKSGYLDARITVGSAAFFVTAGFFLTGLYMSSLYIAAPLFFLAAAGLGGTNAPLDAARLDIMHSRLWGRAESVRTTFRYVLEALAPIVFGWVSTFFGGSGGFFPEGGGTGTGNMTALTYTFRWMLIMVVAAAVILFWARKFYPRDVATVLASENRNGNSVK